MKEERKGTEALWSLQAVPALSTFGIGWLMYIIYLNSKGFTWSLGLWVFFGIYLMLVFLCLIL